jgi:hypothetical protein
MTDKSAESVMTGGSLERIRASGKARAPQDYQGLFKGEQRRQWCVEAPRITPAITESADKGMLLTVTHRHSHDGRVQLGGGGAGGLARWKKAVAKCPSSSMMC